MEKKYTDLKPEEVDYILVKTTSGGPFVEDVFFLIFSQENYWQIPNSLSNDFLIWLKQFPSVNLEQFIKSMGCSEERIFILYRGPHFPVLSEQKKGELKERLLALLRGNFDVSVDVIERIAEKLLNRYGESSRYYHSLEHIQNSLWELDQLPDSGFDKVSVELAIWYHDLVYIPHSRTNELDSANEFKNDWGAVSTKLDLEKIYQMILCTPETIKERDLTLMEQYFLDIDYSVLGQRELEYTVYKQNVRLEYHSVPALIYYLKRKAFLKGILRRSLYQTRWFKDRYEKQAIKNMKSELSRMPYRLLPTLPWR